MIVTYYRLICCETPYGHTVARDFDPSEKWPLTDCAPRAGECFWIVPGTLNPEDVQ